MATGIMKGADFAIITPNNHDRIVTDLQGDVFTGLFNLDGMARENPFLMPNMLQILTVDFIIPIQVPRQRMAS